MELLAIFALFSAATINASLPGPCVLRTLDLAMRKGFLATLPTSAGILAGDLALVAAAGAVLLGAVSFSTSSLEIVKWAGVFVLVMLALSGFRTARPAKPLESAHSGWADLVWGFALSFSSPANLIFFVALLPHFLPINDAEPWTFVVVFATVFAACLIAQVGYGIVGCFTRRVLSSSGRKIRIANGVVMLGFAMLAVIAPIQ